MEVSKIYCSACGTANLVEAIYCLSCGKKIRISVETLPTGEPLIDRTEPLAPLRQLHGRYTIVTLLGRGGMGAVYKAEDTQFGNRLVAVKEMRQSNLSQQATARATDQFKQEALLLASLNHPNLPSIYDHFQEDGRWYLVMDFVEGTTLEQHIRDCPGNVLPLAEALDIAIQLTKVLGYLHTRFTPIIFRDLKPLNVMITPDKNTYLIDFGIARLFKEGQTSDTISYVSPGYAAPEQFGETQTTPQSDIYSLGATLHRLISGNNPQSNTPFFNFKPLQTYNSALPPTLSNLVTHMLQSDPAQRPPGMALIRQELEHIQRILQQQAMHLAPAPLVPTQLAPAQLPLYHGNTTSPDPLSHTSIPEKHILLLLFSIMGIVLLVGTIIVSVLVFNHPSSGDGNGSTLLNNSTKTIYTVPPSTVTSAPTAIPATTATTVHPTLMPTNIPAPTTISYPSYSDAQTAIQYYYENVSDFRGKNIIQSFDSLTYQQQTGPLDQPQFIACAQYKFASISSPGVTTDTARHTFNFQYGNSTWTVIDMGNWNSC